LPQPVVPQRESFSEDISRSSSDGALIQHAVPALASSQSDLVVKTNGFSSGHSWLDESTRSGDASSSSSSSLGNSMSNAGTRSQSSSDNVNTNGSASDIPFSSNSYVVTNSLDILLSRNSPYFSIVSYATLNETGRIEYRSLVGRVLHLHHIADINQFLLPNTPVNCDNLWHLSCATRTLSRFCPGCGQMKYLEFRNNGFHITYAKLPALAPLTPSSRPGICSSSYDSNSNVLSIKREATDAERNAMSYVRLPTRYQELRVQFDDSQLSYGAQSASSSSSSVASSSVIAQQIQRHEENTLLESMHERHRRCVQRRFAVSMFGAWLLGTSVIFFSPVLLAATFSVAAIRYYINDDENIENLPTVLSGAKICAGNSIKYVSTKTADVAHASANGVKTAVTSTVFGAKATIDYVHEKARSLVMPDYKTIFTGIASLMVLSSIVFACYRRYLSTTKTVQKRRASETSHQFRKRVHESFDLASVNVISDTVSNIMAVVGCTGALTIGVVNSVKMYGFVRSVLGMVRDSTKAILILLRIFNADTNVDKDVELVAEEIGKVAPKVDNVDDDVMSDDDDEKEAIPIVPSPIVEKSDTDKYFSRIMKICKDNIYLFSGFIIIACLAAVYYVRHMKKQKRAEAAIKNTCVVWINTTKKIFCAYEDPDVINGAETLHIDLIEKESDLPDKFVLIYDYTLNASYPKWLVHNAALTISPDSWYTKRQREGGDRGGKNSRVHNKINHKNITRIYKMHHRSRGGWIAYDEDGNEVQKDQMEVGSALVFENTGEMIDYANENDLTDFIPYGGVDYYNDTDLVRIDLAANSNWGVDKGSVFDKMMSGRDESGVPPPLPVWTHNTPKLLLASTATSSSPSSVKISPIVSETTRLSDPPLRYGKLDMATNYDFYTKRLLKPTRGILVNHNVSSSIFPVNTTTSSVDSSSAPTTTTVTITQVAKHGDGPLAMPFSVPILQPAKLATPSPALQPVKPVISVAPVREVANQDLSPKRMFCDNYYCQGVCKRPHKPRKIKWLYAKFPANAHKFDPTHQYAPRFTSKNEIAAVASVPQKKEALGSSSANPISFYYNRVGIVTVHFSPGCAKATKENSFITIMGKSVTTKHTFQVDDSDVLDLTKIVQIDLTLDGVVKPLAKEKLQFHQTLDIASFQCPMNTQSFQPARDIKTELKLVLPSADRSKWVVTHGKKVSENDVSIVYTCATDYGWCGSPVLDVNDHVVGVHVAGSGNAGSEPRNECVRISAIASFLGCSKNL